MKTFFSCPVCFEEDGNPLNSFFDGHLGDDDISTYSCPRNHIFRIISRNDKYRTLFDEAIIQLQEGFYENAILDAYTSLEEFMKFFIKFHLHITGFSAKEILDFITTIRFAENKKGAFLLNYFQIFNENNISEKLKKFAELRNNIIHNGKFVSKDESYEFCKNIYNFINGIILKLNQKYEIEDYVKMDFKFQEYFYNTNKDTTPIMASSVSIPSILPTIGMNELKSFEEEYELFKSRKKYCYQNPLKEIVK